MYAQIYTAYSTYIVVYIQDDTASDIIPFLPVSCFLSSAHKVPYSAQNIVLTHTRDGERGLDLGLFIHWPQYFPGEPERKKSIETHIKDIVYNPSKN